ncbi:hypothetical protein [Ureibacillus acetophenoni]|uniref:Uncharacterized protein n=1 Tax=Ureibacillus acetophenoni TaxID=614649 RepID=A0A285USR5_9BACL|nr:hypothetical protein [Ureibacillus acetophenoni]SOC44438.1 hypothetical protein SAMN05877842_12023 [Ureibacillus acetophenoni]
MAILNSQYAFLEADFNNPNLNFDKKKIEQNKTKSTDNNQIESGNQIALKVPSKIYLKSIPMIYYLNVVPADIYSASLFLLIKNF